MLFQLCVRIDFLINIYIQDVQGIQSISVDLHFKDRSSL